MGLPTGEVQTALIALYRNDTTLQGLLVGSSAPTWNVFGMSSEPSGTAFPYLSVGIPSGVQGIARAMGLDAVDLVAQFSIFTRSGGFLQARAIAKQVYALIEPPATLSLTGGFTHVMTQLKSYNELEEPDGIQHVPLQVLLSIQG